MTLLSLLLCTVAFWCLAASMPRNRKFLISPASVPLSDNTLKYAGFLFLTLSLILSCESEGIAEGIVYWCYEMTVGALLVALYISNNQRRKARK
ncbi:DUF3325 domain-containing protein [Alteromonas sp. 1_MG-2023]|uniref:DUF3325 domain-containing protein n=1 Tax=Alteromonas sp. 1_MG-2023 TaxID=3062669 RepID=UPI0026E4599E|nr:DUF3325 domain-containing protein [Alteromonas sp. 1_MG-2023]MDO6475345.1 DUF3325 domain-containing protein [Alteromonas sp. 1_MG-2023]